MPPAKLFEESTLTVEGIKDFQVCALLFYYRHNQEREEPLWGREALSIRYELTLRRVINFFFYKKQQAGAAPSYNALLNRWEKLWFPKDMTAYDLATSQHETSHGNLASYTNDAAMCLLKFHEDFYTDVGVPLLISEQFVVPINRGLRLGGQFDLVLLYPNKTHKVIKISTKQKRPSRSSLLLDFAAIKYAFEYRNQQHGPRARYYLYDAGSSRPGYIDFHPSQSDVDALIFWAAEAAQTENFVPRRGLTAACKGCPFDDPCSEFTINHATIKEIMDQ